MQSFVQGFLADRVGSFTALLDRFDREISPDANPVSDRLVAELTSAIHHLLADCHRMEAALAGEPVEVLRGVQARFRDAIWPWFGKSWFMQRALAKPRGYPGDYELLTAIYNGQPKSLGLGGYLDRYFLETTLGRAVPARMRALARFLTSEVARRPGKTTILDVACGACREFVEGFSIPHDRQALVMCVDSDIEALDYVQREVVPRVDSRVSFEFVRYNALRMASAKANVKRFGRPDVLYSVGLCDYISDEYLVPMLHAWRETVAPGGVVYIAFKDCRRYDSAEYQWLVDWHFLKRTEEDCWRLFEKAGYALDSLHATRDETGVIIDFFERLPAASTTRIDAAEELLSPHADAVSIEDVKAAGS